MLTLSLLNTARGIKGMFYLYIKTHKVTGLKYLGQTSRNPYTYKGSGLRWNNHLKKYGNDVDTEILLETDDKNELSAAGIYYSNLYNVVNDHQWANIVNESGTGGDTSDSPKYADSIKKRNMDYKKDPLYRKKVSSSVKQSWIDKVNDPNFDINAYKKMCSDRNKSMWKRRGITEEDKKSRSKNQAEYVNKPGIKESLSIKSKEAWIKKSKTYEVTFPCGKIEKVKCLRGWCKDNDLPYYKLYNTLRVGRPSPDGWNVKVISVE
jgi:hypothetical protein